MQFQPLFHTSGLKYLDVADRIQIKIPFVKYVFFSSKVVRSVDRHDKLQMAPI